MSDLPPPAWLAPDGDPSVPPPPPVLPPPSPSELPPPAWPIAPPPPGTEEGWIGRPGEPRPPRGPSTGLIVGIILTVVLVMTAGVAALVVSRVGDENSTDSQADATPDEPAADRPDGFDDPAPDDVVAQLGAVLSRIDDSELRMIEFQTDVAENLDEDGGVTSGAQAIAEAAGEAGDDLIAIRSRLQQLATEDVDEIDGVRDIRDAYGLHMDAWVAYLDAVLGSPALGAFGSTDAAPFWDEIERTGDDFVDAVATGLPTATPEDLRQFASFIVTRGFGGFSEPGGQFV